MWMHINSKQVGHASYNHAVQHLVMWDVWVQPLQPHNHNENMYHLPGLFVDCKVVDAVSSGRVATIQKHA